MDRLRVLPVIGLSDVALVTTAWKRPYYLLQTLAAWEEVRGYSQLRRHIIKAGASDRLAEVLRMTDLYQLNYEHMVRVEVDDGTLGPWRTNANGFISGFSDPGVKFVIMAEEDIQPSDDALEFLLWGATQFEDRADVLLVNAHSRCGQGWDGPDVKDDPDADPAAVRLLPYFNQWGWATWRDRWEKTLLPGWDYDGKSGHPMQSGHDWNIHLRTMRGHVAVTPDASRTQHIGDREAWAATAETLAFSKAASFREHREPVTYKLSGVM